jgi:UDP-GlcNAc3NAcA epimerase
MKIAIISGARPNFVKLAPLIKAIEQKKEEGYELDYYIVHTGQHYDSNMSKVFFQEMEIPEPHYNLNVGSGSHGKQTAAMLEGIEEVFLQNKPDSVVVIGDTNSTLAGALAASKLLIPIAHMEAGLRSYNKKMPEEINRIICDHTSEMLFVPTKDAINNLHKEGISDERIYVTGDIMFDATLQFTPKAIKHSVILEKNNLTANHFILATIHRAENTNNIDTLKTIFEALTLVNNDVEVVLPLHPRTGSVLAKHGLLEVFQKSLTIIDPVGYLDMLALESNAKAIITDSGGVQKEAFFHQKPCITIRTETEWTETVDSGWNLLCPPKSVDFIYAGVNKMLYDFNPEPIDPYGEGNSAILMLDALLGVKKETTLKMSI